MGLLKLLENGPIFSVRGEGAKLAVWRVRYCEGAERPSPRERNDRAGGGCRRVVFPLPRLGAFAILNFKLSNLVHTKVAHNTFGNNLY